jgi:hypothetical protein
MIKYFFAASSIVLASPLLSSPAAASPSWTDIGRAMLPSYGNAELYIDRNAPKPGAMTTGQLHAVLDQPWEDPNASGAFKDIYFRVLADCRDGMVAVQPSWPDGPDESSVPKSALRRPAAGTTDEKLLQAYCR